MTESRKYKNTVGFGRASVVVDDVVSLPRLASADGEQDLRPKLSELLKEGRNADAVARSAHMFSTN